MLETCKELDIAFVGFSPLARGFLSNTFASIDELEDNDIRRSMPRFTGENWAANRKLYYQFADLAQQTGVSPAQLAIKWVLAQADNIHALPGTRVISHLEENAAASDVAVSESVLIEAGKLINQRTVKGPRYGAAAQADIDTEDF